MVKDVSGYTREICLKTGILIFNWSIENGNFSKGQEFGADQKSK